VDVAERFWALEEHGGRGREVLKEILAKEERP
jgi:hypothetical protein